MLWRGVQTFIGGFVLGTVTIGLLYFASLAALRVMGYEYAVVVSNSMAPTAQRGDLVILDPNGTAKLNQVTLFRRGSTLVLHRLVRRNADGTWTSRGDANVAEDPWTVPDRAIVGPALGVLRGFGVGMLAFHASHAAFTRRSMASGKASAGFWITPAVSYTIYSNVISFSGLNSLPTSITYQGDRKLWSSTRYSNLTRIHYEDRKSTRLNSSHIPLSRMPSSA